MALYISLLLSLSLILTQASSSKKLSPGFYSSTCPRLGSIVKREVTKAINQEPRMGASLLRLHFHDCFVQGCDASILLDDKPGFKGEKTANPNRNSARGFEVVDQIKAAVEKDCPRKVSCADLLTIAARDSVELLNGPHWEVSLGRRDSTKASRQSANNNIPAPTSNLSQLVQSFAKFNLSSTDMVALSGAHTIGSARCTSFRTRIYNESNIDRRFAKYAKVGCPVSGQDNNLKGLDFGSDTVFDNVYFQNLVGLKALLSSCHELFNKGKTDDLVRKYANDQKVFFDDFVAAMKKMGNINPITGIAGQIRKNCRSIN